MATFSGILSASLSYGLAAGEVIHAPRSVTPCSMRPVPTRFSIPDPAETAEGATPSASPVAPQVKNPALQKTIADIDASAGRRECRPENRPVKPAQQVILAIDAAGGDCQRYLDKCSHVAGLAGIGGGPVGRIHDEFHLVRTAERQKPDGPPIL